MSFSLTQTLHRCKRKHVWKKASAGLSMHFPSIVSLLRIFHKFQQRAANVNQTILWKELDRFCVKARKSPIPAGFQSQFRSSLTLAYIKVAIRHVKKTWLQSSCSLQRAHNLSDGPCRLATCSHVGSLSWINCHKKIWMLGGTLHSQTSRHRRSQSIGPLPIVNDIAISWSIP
jgi:hypothetical protein